MKSLKYTFALLLVLLTQFSFAETGYRLWLRYDKIENQALRERYSRQINSINFAAKTDMAAVAKKEILMALKGLLGKDVIASNNSAATILIGTPESSLAIKSIVNQNELPKSADGFLIKSIIVNGHQQIIISSISDKGILYGVFHFIRLLQTNASLVSLNIKEEPAIKNRILNHWDNLDGTVERGYAGSSLWEWHKLPCTLR
eukprot:Opistho-1_new@76807